MGISNTSRGVLEHINHVYRALRVIVQDLGPSGLLFDPPSEGEEFEEN